MGYYTVFEFEVVDGAAYPFDDILAQFRRDSYGAKYSLDESGNPNDSSKWYEWETDFKVLSLKFPSAKLRLSGNGEENEDQWIAYAHGGRVQTVRAKITFDPCTLW